MLFNLLHALYLFNKKPVFGSHINYLFIYLFIYGLFSGSLTISYGVASLVGQ